MVSEQQDIHAIFNEAIVLASEEDRLRYLDQACGSDLQVRARVDALLHAHSEAGDFFGGKSAVDATNILPITEHPGTVIGPYKLLQHIGEGGMGVVFMAEQTEPLQRTVALKIIKPGMDTRQVIARFEAERQAVAMMDHPNIAKVLDAGATDSGRPFFVMELVKGVPITKYCDDKQLPLRERLELFVQVCQAVQHAHQKGVIHRDIKPNNVLVAEYDNEPIPKVIDFGVAKATAQRLTERTMFTEVGQVLGTMEYMSPEQAKLNQLDVDTRSDVYSLGVLLYELLAGSTPFEGKRLKEAAFDETLCIIREEEPSKPSTRLSSIETLPSVAANRHTEPARLSKDVQGELDWIVMKALEKDRNRRYETASGFAADIERHLHDQPVEAGPPSAAYRFRKFAKRNKGALLVTSVVAAAMILGLAGTTWQAIRATHAEQQAKTEAAIAQAANDFLNNDLLAQADPTLPYDRYNEPSGELKLNTVLDRAAARLDGRFADQPLVEAALRQTIGFTYSQLDNKNRGRLHLERAVELRRTHLGDEHPDTLSSMYDLARASADEKLSRQVLEARRRVLGEEHADTLRSLTQLGYRLRGKGDITEGVALLRQALGTQRRLLGDDHHNTAYTKYALADALCDGYDSNASPGGKLGLEIEALYREALAAFRKQHGNSAWHTFHATLLLGKFLNSPGHYERTEAVLKDGYLRLQSQSATPPEWAAELAGELARLYRNWNKPEQAAEWERNRLAANESALARSARLVRNNADDPNLMASHGSLLNRLQRYGEAEAAYRAAINLRPDDAHLHELLGDACSAQSRFAEAETALREAIRLEPNHGGRHRKLGDLLVRQGKLTEAEVEYAKAMEQSSGYWENWYSLAQLYHQQHQSEKSQNALATAVKLSTNPGEQNSMAWRLATDPDPSWRNPELAVELAEKAIAARPNEQMIWNTLGAARFRNGQWKDAISALEKSMELDNGGDERDWYLLAMAHWQLDDKEGARKWYEQAVDWAEKNQPHIPEVPRLRAETERLLKIADEKQKTKPESN